MDTRLIRVEGIGAGKASLHTTGVEGNGRAALEKYGPIDGKWIVLNANGTWQEYLVSSETVKTYSRVLR